TGVRTAYTAVVQAIIDPADPKKSYAAGGVYRTTDGGTTWSALYSPGPFDSGASAVAVAPDGRLFASFLSSYGSGLLCSVDGGAHWSATCPHVGHWQPHKAGTQGAATPAAGACATACSPSPAAATAS